MPCNLAVTITKAAVEQEHLNKLLTPQVVEQALRAFLTARDRNATVRVNYGTVYASTGYNSVSVFRGRVSVSNGNRDTRGAEKLAAETQQLLAALADTLFAQQVQSALQGSGARVASQQVVVDNAGRRQVATVLSFNL